MEKKQPGKGPTMEGPATYRIRIQGHLDARWSDRIGGMKITEARECDGEVESVLVGRLADQAALSGVLNTLYDLHLPVVSVEFVDRGKE